MLCLPLKTKDLKWLRIGRNCVGETDIFFSENKFENQMIGLDNSAT